MANSVKINGKVYRAHNITRRLVYPQAGGQYAAYWSNAFELLGGGSAGGGKSWFLVVDALGLQYQLGELGRAAFQCEGYRAVLFRREATQLDKLITEAKLYYPQYGGVWCGGRIGEPGPSFEFPQYGSKIFFCHLQHEADKENHQGQEYQFCGFDELTHFSITQYLYLISRLRSPIPGLTCRLRATTNPTGEGLWWVRKRFVDGRKPGVVNYYLPPEDPEIDPKGELSTRDHPDSMSRVFVPFWLNENKVLVDTDPQYASRMKALGRQMEKALLGGDWYAFGGDLFPDFDRKLEVIAPMMIPESWPLVFSIDPAYSTFCSAGLNTVDPQGHYYRIATYYQDKLNADKHAAAIKKWITDCKWTRGRWPDRMIAGRDAWNKDEKYATVESDKTFADHFSECDRRFFFEPALTDRVPGWWNWKGLMPNRWLVFKDENEPLLDEMAAAVTDEKYPEDLKDRGRNPEIRDHAMDECRYALMAMAPRKEPPKEDTGWESQWLKGAGRSRQVAGWSPGRG